MNRQNTNLPKFKDSVTLSLPVNAAYVSAARLTASTIANRMGFDIDEIEDVKAAVSEACIFIIRKAPVDQSGLFKIVFNIGEDFLDIAISCGKKLAEAEPEEQMGLHMIRTLMDEMISESDSGGFFMQLKKIHKLSPYS